MAFNGVAGGGGRHPARTRRLTPRSRVSWTVWVQSGGVPQGFTELRPSAP